MSFAWPHSDAPWFRVGQGIPEAALDRRRGEVPLNGNFGRRDHPDSNPHFSAEFRLPRCALLSSPRRYPEKAHRIELVGCAGFRRIQVLPFPRLCSQYAKDQTKLEAKSIDLQSTSSYWIRGSPSGAELEMAFGVGAYSLGGDCPSHLPHYIHSTSDKGLARLGHCGP